MGGLRVGVSGAFGRMGSLTCEAVDSVDDLALAARYAPGQGLDNRQVMADCDVIVEFAPIDTIMENLEAWRGTGAQVVVGTSGFDRARIDELIQLWEGKESTCLLVPNFSLGAVVMMWLAEKVSPYFTAAEVVELHHDRKADAPSGTALATAGRMRPAGNRAVESAELIPGARGAEVGDVWVHSIRLPGLLAHQEVLLGNHGELLTIRHDTTDRAAFVPGILIAIRAAPDLPSGVTVGLEPLLGL
ncbi:MAG TPA: 4-hydroxy-tetrahydrodipicolinate reductase [Acidimicrobiia bacterium]|nr:4-hydroxy-tetrahydrodipicolinate reductase [Acidimicrobiia bacterium]